MEASITETSLTQEKVAHLLFVDDDAAIRQVLPEYVLLCSLPRRITFDVCSSGNEAIELIRRGSQFDLIVSDYAMPDGSGADLLAFLQQNRIQIPIIIFSSARNHDLPAASGDFLGFIPKPDDHKLITAIESALSSKCKNSSR